MDKKIKKLRILRVCLIISMIFINIFNYNQNNFKDSIEKDSIINLKYSEFYLIDSFTIDDSGNGEYTWVEISEQPWCNGNGSTENPYIIENIVINGNYEANCLKIKNSNVYFIVRNCSFFNSGTVYSLYFAGIRLINVTNGQFINNTCNDNFIGIYLSNCENNIFLKNVIKDNEYRGIWISDFSHFNYIKENVVVNNKNGIYISSSDSNYISGNFINNNTGYGIEVIWSNQINISRNTANNNTGGIKLTGGRDHEVIGNIAYYNIDSGISISNIINSNITANILNYNYKRGLHLMSINNENNISGNIANYNKENGFRIAWCENIEIKNNTANFNGQVGINLYSDNNITVSNNVLEGNYENGISFYFGNNNSISRNFFKESGIGFSGIYKDTSIHNIDVSNLLNGNPIYYYINEVYLNQNNFSNAGNPGQIILVNCNHSIIENFNVSIISLYYCESNIISGINTIYNSVNGIYLHKCFNSTVKENILNENSIGIFIDQCENISISGNILNKNIYGIRLVEGINNALSSNIMLDCGVKIEGSIQRISSYKIDITNTIDGNPIYYYVNEFNLNKDSFLNAGQVILVNCTNSEVSDLNITSGTSGISLFYCKNISITNNSVEFNNKYGLCLIYSFNLNISENRINNNSFDGIYLYKSNNATIHNNNICYNYRKGIFLFQSNYTTIYNNIFNGYKEKAIYEEDCIGNIVENNYISGYWHIQSLFIDGTSSGIGAHNWTWAISQSWCRGAGSFNDPYIIENISVDHNGNGSCIELINSNVFFKIQNVIIYDSGIDYYDAGIKLNNTHNGELINNKFTNIIRTGIILFNCNNITILDHIIIDKFEGICLYKSNNNTILGNTANNNDENGLRLYQSNYNLIKNNIFIDNRRGILEENSSDNTFVNNTCIDRSEAFFISPIIIDDLGNGDYTWVEASKEGWCSGFGTKETPYIIKNVIIDGNGPNNCIEIHNSDIYFIIENCTFLNSNGLLPMYTYGGILLVNVTNGVITNNNCSSTQNGIRLLTSSDNLIFHNNLEKNLYDGIHIISYSYNNIILNNIISYNNFTLSNGIRLQSSSNNTISGNMIIQNTQGLILTGNSHFNNISENLFYNNLICISIDEGCNGNIIEHNYNYLIPAGIFQKEITGNNNFNISLSISVKNFTKIFFLDYAHSPINKDLIDSVIFIDLSLNDTSNLDNSTDHPINITIKYDPTIYENLTVWVYNAFANNGIGKWELVSSYIKKNGMIIISGSNSSIIALVDSELKEIFIPPENFIGIIFTIIIISILIGCFISIIANSIYNYNKRIFAKKAIIRKQKDKVHEKIIPNQSSKEIIEQIIDESSLFQIFDNNEPFKEINYDLIENIDLIHVSRILLTKLDKCDLKGIDKMIFIKEMLAFPSKIRNDILDDILKKLDN